MNLMEKSIHTLELPSVLDLLAAQAYSEEARERAAALRPAVCLSDAELWQEQTTAARAMMALRPAPGFSGLKRVGDSLSRAELGGQLNTRELLDIAGVLRVTLSIKAYGAASREASKPTVLDPLFRLLQGNKFLENKISAAIVSEEEIADGASPELADIRRHLRVTQGKVRETLHKFVSSAAQSKFLQDTLVTQRGGRFVVPVKAEHKGDVPGLVHDVSSSGATLFVEPMAVVNLNNEIRELEAREKKEIDRILAELSADCAGFAELISSDYHALVSLDLIFARGKLSYQMEADAPLLNQKGRLNLIRARHPLLEAKTAVPISVSLGRGFDTLVITGPNTGGKTVTLKTIGLLSLMAACGLHIPAGSGSEVPVWEAVYADIGDEQSIEQSLSTFSSHMTNIVGILERAGRDSLVLFDELGAGTDPVEGAALAVSIIQYTRNMGAKVAATTHYAELKSFALSTDGVENASCEFDVETLRPTYRLIVGIPGRSNAFAISRRLGLPESIIQTAKEHVSTENAAFEDIITRLEAQRQALENEYAQVRIKLREAEESAKKSAELRSVLEKQREKHVQTAQSEARRIIEAAREEADSILKELGRMKAQGLVNEDLTAFRARLNEAEKQTRSAPEPELPPREPLCRPLKAGDTVLIHSMNTKASVLEPADRDGNVRLLAGMLKISVSEEDLSFAEPDKPVHKPRTGDSLRTAAVSSDCDLRGLDSSEALMVLENFLDSALTSKLQKVTVIHGKGTGVLRNTVHQALRKHKQVKSFRLGVYGEGENGVTVAELK